MIDYLFPRSNNGLGSRGMGSILSSIAYLKSLLVLRLSVRYAQASRVTACTIYIQLLLFDCIGPGLEAIAIFRMRSLHWRRIFSMEVRRLSKSWQSTYARMFSMIKVARSSALNSRNSKHSLLSTSTSGKQSTHDKKETLFNREWVNDWSFLGFS